MSLWQLPHIYQIRHHVSYICHHVSSYVHVLMYWRFPFANQTSKEVHHAGIESLARTPTANVRNGVRLESHHVSKPLQAIQRIKQTCSLMSLWQLPHIYQIRHHVSYICHHVSSYVHVLMYWRFPFANQTSKEVHHAGIESLARTPTANVRNGVRLESHHVSKPLQTIQRIKQTCSPMSLWQLPHIYQIRHHVSYICHHVSSYVHVLMYWRFPFANQTSKEVHHAGIESLARTPTANVRNGVRLESHHVSKPLQAIQRIKQTCSPMSLWQLPRIYQIRHHVSPYVLICHHVSMYSCTDDSRLQIRHLRRSIMQALRALLGHQLRMWETVYVSSLIMQANHFKPYNASSKHVLPCLSGNYPTFIKFVIMCHRMSSYVIIRPCTHVLTIPICKSDI